MRNSLFLIVIFFPLFVFSQHNTLVSSVSNDINKEVENELLVLREEMELKGYISKCVKHLEIEFTLDTARIEKTIEKKVNIDWSDEGIIATVHEAEREYSNLVEKYYKLLEDRLSEEDKVILRTAHNNWVEYRNSERSLNSKMVAYSKDDIKEILAADKFLWITKERLLNIYRHLYRMCD